MSSDPPASPLATRRGALLLAAAGVVHATRHAHAAGHKRRTGQQAAPGAGSASAAPSDFRARVGRDPARLPPAAADMRTMILGAVESGDIAELEHAVQVNEMKPDFGAPAGVDAIEHLRSLSGDGKGREILALLSRTLEAGWITIPGGRDIENNRIHIWPWLAEAPLDALTGSEEVELYRLVTPADANAMRSAKRWTWWRLAIGADGVWHSFTKAA